MKEDTRREQVQQFTNFFGCSAIDLAGQTLQSLLEDAEQCGAIVFWYYWTQDDLATILVEDLNQ